MLAAEALGFDDCYSLKSFGRTGLLYKCEATAVTFSVFQDRCGPQPDYRNQTIAKDGRTLIPLTPCAWKDGIVNFAGSVYQYRDGNWVPVTPSIVARTAQLQTSFNFTTDRLDRYASLFPAEDSTNIFQLFGELDGLLSDGSFTTITEFTEAHKELATTSVFSVIVYYTKWVVFTGATLVVTGLVLYFIVKYNNALSLCLNGFQLCFSAIRQCFRPVRQNSASSLNTPSTAVIYQNPETVRLPVRQLYPPLDRRTPEPKESIELLEHRHQHQQTNTAN